MNPDDTTALQEMLMQATEAQRAGLPGNPKPIRSPKMKKLAIKLRNPSLIKALGGSPISEEEFGDLAQMLRMGRS